MGTTRVSRKELEYIKQEILWAVAELGYIETAMEHETYMRGVIGACADRLASAYTTLNKKTKGKKHV